MPRAEGTGMTPGRNGQNGGGPGPDVAGPGDDGVDRPMTGSIEMLARATQRLAATIAVTERLAEGRAEMLRTMDAAVGMGGRGGFEPRGIVSLAEASRRTGRHAEVLRRWCIEGRIPAVKVGRTWAISNETLGTLIQHRSRSRPRLTPAATE
jgi:excisionase family DNA binding protein